MPANERPSRRQVVAAGLAGCAATAAAVSHRAAAAAEAVEPFIASGDVVLFQGDSITDAGRDFSQAAANLQPAMGAGYAWMAASHLLVERPADGLKAFNRGISGNKVFQLAERWDADCLALRPDVVSILIGVNDLWHRRNGDYDGNLETYQADYRRLLERTKDALPAVKLVLAEPFVLMCGAVDASFREELAGFQETVRDLARDFSARLVRYQAAFDAAVGLAPADHWAADGVHPSPFGAALMAHAWLRAAA